MKALVVLSGGMDSTAALYYTLRTQTSDIECVSFDYGQRHYKELGYAHDTCLELGLAHQIVDMKSFGRLLKGSALSDPNVDVPEGHYAAETMKATVVPNRNMIMLSMATGIGISLGVDMIVAGMHAGDHAIYPDCRPEFIAAFNLCARTANEGFGEVRVYAPWLDATKAEIVTAGTALGVPWENTWSCYKGGKIHCGRCSTCVERQEAFSLANEKDPTEYTDSNFWREVVAR